MVRRFKAQMIELAADPMDKPEILKPLPFRLHFNRMRKIANNDVQGFGQANVKAVGEKRLWMV